MEYKFFIQDLNRPEPHYLIEAIIEQLNDTETVLWIGLFAFASRLGIENLLDDTDVRGFLRRGNTELIVGIDAITDPSALEKLRELENHYQKFSVRVFDKQMKGIFHPKIAYFRKDNGRQVIIVGSGNLTPGGLKNNIEAYSVFILDCGENINLNDLDNFLETHADSLKTIDDRLIEKTRQNIIIRRRRRIIEEVEAEEQLEEEIEGLPPMRDNRVLIAEVPRAGGRWHQIHFNIDTNKIFFRVKPNSSERAFLFEKISSTQIREEEVRPVVFSNSNRNTRIEFRATRHRYEPYPKTGRPILVVREIGTRMFHYILLMPNDDGYDKIHNYLQTHKHDSVGRGVIRIITTYNDLMNIWSNCYL